MYIIKAQFIPYMHIYITKTIVCSYVTSGLSENWRPHMGSHRCDLNTVAATVHT